MMDHVRPKLVMKNLRTIETVAGVRDQETEAGIDIGCLETIIATIIGPGTVEIMTATAIETAAMNANKVETKIAEIEIETGSEADGMTTGVGLGDETVDRAQQYTRYRATAALASITSMTVLP